jgi:FMN phosphatase YigB (HAD superfamily)
MDIRLVIFDLDGTLIGAPQPFSELKERLRKELLEMGVDEDLLGDLTPMYESLIRISR